MAEQHHHTHPAHPYADPELKKYMKSVARANKTHYVILRALLTGIFTAIGTTIGFALLIISAAALVTNLKHVPILDTVLQQTKLDVLIEDQLSRIQKGTTENADTVVLETYADSTYNFAFQYPSTFTSVKQVSADAAGRIIQLTGSGALHAVEIYVNKPALVTGDAVEVQVKPEKLDSSLLVNIYEEGAKVNDTQYQNAIFQTKFRYGNDEYTIIGQADNDKPKLAREVYLAIVQSWEFRQ